LKDAKAELRYQFERLGYFCLDSGHQSSTTNHQPVFNRTITLRDAWAKEAQKAWQV
jgi:glutaminyl-tRNA synthetase